MEKNISMTPEKVQEILKKEGTSVTLEQAAKILDFMRILADIAVSVYVRKQPINFIKNYIR